MAIYFAFSDENGTYIPNCPEESLKAHPFYIRSNFIIPAEEWKPLNTKFLGLKKRFGFPLTSEIKWSYIWTLRKYQDNMSTIPTNKPFYFLKDKQYSDLLLFVQHSLDILSQVEGLKIILTITQNRPTLSTSRNEMYKMHIQDTIQRIEMEMESSPDNLCTISADPISKDLNQYFKEIYYKLITSGDYIRRYAHIKDSLNFEFSHHSMGVQMADYISGCTSGLLRGYSFSENLFIRYIYDKLRTSSNDMIMGYGIREVPRNNDLRAKLSHIIGKAYLRHQSNSKEMETSCSQK